MAKIKWDQEGKRLYETGVSNGVLYVHNGVQYQTGVAWNGLISVTESPSGAEATPIYADNIKYLSLTSAEEFAASIEAYTYPDEFAECDGSAELATGVMIGQQKRKKFALVYKTIIGNDTENEAHGYKLHIIYGCQAAPSERAYTTVNDSPEAITFSWEISTTPVEVADHKPTSILTLDSTKVGSVKMKKVEDKLFGDDSTGQPTLLTPDEVLALVNAGE